MENALETGPILVTDDKEEIISALEAVHIHGGGDCPEPSISAIIDGLKLALPHSYVLVFTDASAKDFWLEHDAEELLQRKQATVCNSCWISVPMIVKITELFIADVNSINGLLRQ